MADATASYVMLAGSNPTGDVSTPERSVARTNTVEAACWSQATLFRVLPSTNHAGDSVVCAELNVAGPQGAAHNR